VLNELAAAGGAIDAGKDAWVCRRVDDPINGWNCFKVARGAQISMDQLNTPFLKRFAVQRASGTTEIVDAMI